jgi:uroporphyrinogen-III synthase
VREELERIVIASIGPMTSEELRHQGLPIDFEPSHPKMGFLVKEVAEKCRALIGAKRHPNPTTCMEAERCTEATT